MIQEQLDKVLLDSMNMRNDLGGLLQGTRKTIESIMEHENIKPPGQKTKDGSQTIDVESIKVGPSSLNQIKMVKGVTDQLMDQLKSAIDMSTAYLNEFEEVFQNQ